MMNVPKLQKELDAAGIQNGGCNDAGKVWDVDGVTEIQDRADVAEVVALHNPTPEADSVIVYDKPIQAPDFIVASPKPKTNPKEALFKAVGEARKGHGVPKSSMTILLNLIEYIDDLEKRVDVLEKAKLK